MRGLIHLVRGNIARVRQRLSHEQGSTIVEMSIALSLFATVLLGVVQTCMMLYAYHFVSDAAREASRWAMVRGSNCSINVNVAFCSPTDGVATGADPNDIQAFVNGLGFPFARNLTATTTWLTSSGTAPITWSACAGSPCNTPGSQVQITVSYNFPFAVPFWKSTGVSISSTSSMVIAQ